MGFWKAKSIGRKLANNTAPWLDVSVAAVIVIIALAAIAVVIGGCGMSSAVGDAGTISTTGGTNTTTTTTLAPETTSTSVAAETTTTTLTDNAMTVTVYFARDEKIAAAHRVILKTLELGRSAMLELLAGPSISEADQGMTSTIPAGTTFLSLDIKNGVATVNLSKEYESGGGSLSMSLRLAQVVYTLTQFSTVNKVTFQLDGKPVPVFGGEGIILNHPVGRSDYEDVTPSILVESPTLGETVSSPVHVTGSANTFEGMFTADIIDESGAVIADRAVAAASGTGQRGKFEVDIPYKVTKTGVGALVVFGQSAKDGSRINLVSIPLTLQK